MIKKYIYSISVKCQLHCAPPGTLFTPASFTKCVCFFSLQHSNRSRHPEPPVPGSRGHCPCERSPAAVWSLLQSCQILLLPSHWTEVLLQEPWLPGPFHCVMWLQQSLREYLLQQPCLCWPWVACPWFSRCITNERHRATAARPLTVLRHFKHHYPVCQKGFAMLMRSLLHFLVWFSWRIQIGILAIGLFGFQMG